MTGLEYGAIGFAGLLVLLALRIPIGISMLVVGMIGYTTIAGLPALLNHLKTDMYWRFTTFDLSVVPMFILMGQFAAKAGQDTKIGPICGPSSSCVIDSPCAGPSAEGGTISVILDAIPPFGGQTIPGDGQVVGLHQSAGPGHHGGGP